MWPHRFRKPGILLVAMATGTAAWSLLGRDRHAGMPSPAAITGELTVPVEIVVTGQEPQRREIRVPQ